MAPEPYLICPSPPIEVYNGMSQSSHSRPKWCVVYGGVGLPMPLCVGLSPLFEAHVLVEGRQVFSVIIRR